MSELLLLLPKFNSLAIISKKFLWLYRNFPLLEKAVIEEWDKRQREVHKDDINIDHRILELKTQAKLTVDKIKYLTSEVAMRYMEEDLVKTEQQIADLLAEKQKVEQEKPADIRVVMAYIEYYLKHLDELLLDNRDPMNKAGHFGVLFDQAPTYKEISDSIDKKIKGETPNLAYCIKLNEVFIMGQGKLAAGHGFEP